ncbi:MAG: hypothetical protein RMK49_07630 [Abditibacteriales bacterium]|nr:hypothetical protein [Abditibacteriales bacterium]
MKVEQERSLALDDVMDTFTHALPRRGCSVELSQPNQINSSSANPIAARQPDVLCVSKERSGWTEAKDLEPLRKPHCPPSQGGPQEVLGVMLTSPNPSLIRRGEFSDRLLKDVERLHVAPELLPKMRLTVDQVFAE